ncbi:MAG: hypothetical protein FGM46_05135 [Ferruginibacter sp.]|nr:hypothetical protein [Ferruginibacter sp.]
MKTLIFLSLVLIIGNTTFAQSKPYQNGSYDFGVFDKEYSKTTARCIVTIKGNSVIATVSENLYGNIYRINQVIYKGKIIKKGGLYYIIEKNSPPISSEDFEYSTSRIDFNRGLIIHN